MLLKGGPILTTHLFMALLATHSVANTCRIWDRTGRPLGGFESCRDSIFGSPKSSCTMLTHVRPNQAGRGMFESAWPGLDEAWSKLQKFMREIRKSRSRQPSATFERSQLVYLFATCWVVKRAAERGVVEMGPLLTSPLDDHALPTSS